MFSVFFLPVDFINQSTRTTRRGPFPFEIAAGVFESFPRNSRNIEKLNELWHVCGWFSSTSSYSLYWQGPTSSTRHKKLSCTNTYTFYSFFDRKSRVIKITNIYNLPHFHPLILIVWTLWKSFKKPIQSNNFPDIKILCFHFITFQICVFATELTGFMF